MKHRLDAERLEDGRLEATALTNEYLFLDFQNKKMTNDPSQTNKTQN